MRRIRILITGSLLVWCLGAGAGAKQPSQESKLPNIVFIMSDELAYYELSHMGNPRIKTPRIDRMAAALALIGERTFNAPARNYTISYSNRLRRQATGEE